MYRISAVVLLLVASSTHAQTTPSLSALDAANVRACTLRFPSEPIEKIFDLLISKQEPFAFAEDNQACDWYLADPNGLAGQVTLQAGYSYNTEKSPQAARNTFEAARDRIKSAKTFLDGMDAFYFLVEAPPGKPTILFFEAIKGARFISIHVGSATLTNKQVRQSVEFAKFLLSKI